MTTTSRPGRVPAVALLLPLASCAMLVTACVATRGTAVPASRSAPSATQTIIAALKAYETRVGFAPTRNFVEATNVAFAGRCYYTGKLELPESYQALRLVGANNGRCSLDESALDVFPYALETAATGTSAVTPALENATLARMLMLVPHEDFHNQPEAQRAAPSVAEAAATLAGFVTAAGFAREYFGPDSTIVRHLATEPTLFAAKAAIVNRYYDEVAALYAAYRAGHLQRDDVLDRKHRLFAELGQTCVESHGTPVSFNQCPAVLNNAGLAFDRTYTRDFPALLALARRLDTNVSETVARLRQTLAAGASAVSQPAWPD